MTTILIALFCLFSLVSGILVIAASLMRCPRCGGWHEGKECEKP